jgi:uncharacterized protein YbgA (DUF1722 family)
MIGKMSAYIRSVKKIEKDSESSKDPEMSFAINWANHVVSVIRKNKNDRQFVGEVVMSASEYFKNELNDQQKTDVFCFLLGSITRNNSGK